MPKVDLYKTSQEVMIDSRTNMFFCIVCKHIEFYFHAHLDRHYMPLFVV